MGIHRAIGPALLAALLFTAAAQADVYAERRAALIKEIDRYSALAWSSDAGAMDEAVMAVLGEVPRHEFVPEREKRYAYENRPLPIGFGQTISQPYIVALMTDLVEPETDDVVLEIGTGSAYQAAVLGELVAHVYTIEIVEPLHESATERLERLGYENVTTRLGDGYYGWQQHAPFDAIVVTAAASHVPPPLINQLKPGGRMVIPVGNRFMTQQLLLIEKTSDDEVITRQIGAVRFVPLTGKH